MQREIKLEKPPAAPGANSNGAAPAADGVGTQSSARDGSRPVDSWLATLREFPDLALIAGLLLLTATLSRTFSTGIQIGPFYVTELVMALAGTVAILRLGADRSWRMLRRLPLPALAIFWAVGLIATLRGLREFGFSLVSEDIGLFDYSLLLPLLALVVLDRRRQETLFAVLIACGFAGMAAFTVVYTVDQISG
ncbi:MAG: hypothetical protein H0V25_00990, partial [Solirubrobacterales bacterium]|nr:hypothetical protein [Solirubrobacterales bacterium]